MVKGEEKLSLEKRQVGALALSYAGHSEDAFAAAQRGNRFLAAQALQNDADLFLGPILLAGRAADVFDDLLRWRFPGSGFLSHLRSFERLR